MTEMEFKSYINRRLTMRCSLPFKLPTSGVIDDIIYDCMQWFHKHYDDALEQRYMVLPLEWFCTEEFKKNRIIKLPKCVMYVQRIYESGSGLSRNLSSNLSWTSPEDLLYIVSWESFRSIANQFDKNLVTAKYNENSKNLVILGETPNNNCVAEVSIKSKFEDLSEDQLFQKYCLGWSLKSLSLILGAFDYNLPGDIKINYDEYKELGNEMIEEVENEIDEEPFMWFFTDDGI